MGTHFGLTFKIKDPDTLYLRGFRFSPYIFSFIHDWMEKVISKMKQEFAS